MSLVGFPPPPIHTASQSIAVLQGLQDQWTHDPVGFVASTYRSDPEGNPVEIDPGQARILAAVGKSDRVAVRSAHGVGKTTTAAWLSQWWLATRWPALVVTLAGTWPHNEDRLWPEIRLWANNWRFRDAWVWQHLEVHHGVSPDISRVIAASSDVADNVEGFHSANLLLIVDEAKALPAEVWLAVQGALTKRSAKVVVLSTPPLTPVGWYPDLFGPKGRGWTTLHIPATQSKRVSKEWIEEIANNYGVASAAYRAKVLGEIPDSEGQVVITLGMVLAAQERQPIRDRKRPVVTIDVARGGEDLTAVGLIMDSKHALVEWQPKSTTVSCAKAARNWVQRVRAGFLCIDDTGIGGGVTDLIIAWQRQDEFPKDCTIIPVVFGAEPGHKGRFKRLKDELWWYARDALKSSRLALQSDAELATLQLPRGSDLKAQLLAPIYSEDLQSRIEVYDHRKPTDHQEFKKALPTKSPDLAHTLVLGAKTYLTQADTVYNEPETPMETVNREFWDRMRRQRHGLDQEPGEEYGYSDRLEHFYGDGRGGGDNL